MYSWQPMSNSTLLPSTSSPDPPQSLPSPYVCMVYECFVVSDESHCLGMGGLHSVD